MSNVWKTLSAIDVSNHIDTKGGLNYLSWGWAWATLMEHYPDSTYSYSDAKWCEITNTVEVEVTVTVEGKAVSMWLPVMDHRNKAIENPKSRDISDARIRCLVKAIAMQGLGMCLYMGEVKPQVVTDATKQQEEYNLLIDNLKPSIQAIKDGIATDDLATASEEWQGLTTTEKELLWKAPSKGGVFSTQERTLMKTAEFREAGV
ncbi:MAG: DUF1071 domain-containing protein [Porticoccaceae bacterium]|nr:DUF1071 domain-containing protein [Porticoccaceae bacterium]